MPPASPRFRRDAGKINWQGVSITMNSTQHRMLFMHGFGLVSLIAVLLTAPSVWAAQVTIGAATAGPGATVTLPVTVDKVEKLAGFKLVMSYDAGALSFQKIQKSPKTNGLMDVVNDKKPGQLIVVMAGARGISGEAMPLFDLVFEVKSAVAGQTEINPVSVECMSEDLKPIPAEVKAGVVTVTAGASAKPAPDATTKAATTETKVEPKATPPLQPATGIPAVKP